MALFFLRGKQTQLWENLKRQLTEMGLLRMHNAYFVAAWKGRRLIV
jgi:hypothetical protein